MQNKKNILSMKMVKWFVGEKELCEQFLWYRWGELTVGKGRTECLTCEQVDGDRNVLLHIMTNDHKRGMEEPNT